MPIEHVFSYLVHPSKGEEVQPRISSADLPLAGQLFDTLNDLYVESESDRSIDICFTTQGDRRNSTRELIVALLGSCDLDTGMELAEHLQIITTKRSGLGLLFILLGTSDDGAQKIVLSRFPTNIGIVADEVDDQLNVQLLEKVFMKSAVSYKAAVYVGTNTDSDFWAGKAVDRQINNKSVELSGYWIRDFLMSDFSTTSRMGTRRLAMALQDALQGSADPVVMGEIAAAAALAPGLNGQTISMHNLTERFALSPTAAEALLTSIKNRRLAFSEFAFDAAEFKKNIRFRTLRIDNGAVLTAPVADFDTVFDEERIDEICTRYSTQGRPLGSQLRKAR